MLFHFANDFLNYAQVGGMTAQTWRGDANDWLNLLVQVVVRSYCHNYLDANRAKKIVNGTKYYAFARKLVN